MNIDWPPAQEVVRFSMMSFSSVFFTVDPVGSLPAFLVMGARGSEGHNRRVAKHAAWTCLLVLAVFAATGSFLFKVFGISLPAFRIAGGVLLFQIALEMIHSRRSETQEVAAERAEGALKDDFGITPLGVPMLAGPGAITAVTVLMEQSRFWWQSILVFISILLTSAITFYVLAAAPRVERRLGETGSRILIRLMGIVVAAIATEFVLKGIAEVWLPVGSR